MFFLLLLFTVPMSRCSDVAAAVAGSSIIFFFSPKWDMMPSLRYTEFYHFPHLKVNETTSYSSREICYTPMEWHKSSERPIYANTKMKWKLNQTCWFIFILLMVFKKKLIVKENNIIIFGPISHFICQPIINTESHILKAKYMVVRNNYYWECVVLLQLRSNVN